MKTAQIAEHALLGLLILVWTGCSRVTAPQPVGTEPPDLTATVSSWEGTWLARENDRGPFGELFEINMIDPKLARLQVVWLEVDGPAARYRSAELWLRAMRGRLFANMRQNDSAGGADFLFARVQKEDKRLVFWAPDASEFKRLIVAHKLPGVISENGHARLGDLTEEHLHFISAQADKSLFHGRSPYVWVKASDDLFLTTLRRGDRAAARKIHDQMVECWPGSRPLHQKEFGLLLAQEDPVDLRPDPRGSLLTLK